MDEELNKVIVEESSARDSDSKDTKDNPDEVSESVKTAMGSISFVSCATGEDAMQTLATDPLSEEGRFRDG